MENTKTKKEIIGEHPTDPAIKDNVGPKKIIIEDEILLRGQYSKTKISTNGIFLSRFYDRDYKPAVRYLVVVVCGLFAGFFSLLFVKNSGLYSAGIGGAFQGISRLTYSLMLNAGVQREVAGIVFDIMFWGLYLFCNLPLLYFAYLKIGKRFALMTLTLMCTSSATGFILTLFHDLNSIQLLGNTMTSDTILADARISIIPFSIPDSVQAIHSVNLTPDIVKSLFLMLNAVVYGIISSLIYSVVYLLGGSSGGADIPSIYYSTKKSKNISSILLYVNMGSLVLGNTLGSFLAAGLTNDVYFQWEYFFSANLVASILMSVVISLCFSRFFPLNKKIKMEIITKKPDAISNELFKHRYQHGITNWDCEGAYSNEKRNMLLTVCLQVELNKVISIIREVDEYCYIMLTTLKGVDGYVKVINQGISKHESSRQEKMAAEKKARAEKRKQKSQDKKAHTSYHKVKKTASKSSLNTPKQNEKKNNATNTKHKKNK